MSRQQVIVIGGGAAGLMAAGTAAARGVGVLVLEKMREPARKLRITGKGRCNLTNTAPVHEFIQRFGRDGRFLHQAFARFFAPELMAMFEDLGVAMVEERGGRVFPASGSAPEVAAALVRWARDAGARLQTQAAVTDLLCDDGRVTGVRTRDGHAHHAAAVIIATGGLSYPRTGSTGDGYRLAAQVGHIIVPTRPALVPLESPDVPRDELQDLNLRNVAVRVTAGGKKLTDDFGEVTFTATGLGGPTMLTASGAVIDALARGRAVEVVLDLKPGLTTEKLDARLRRDLDRDGKASVSSLLEGLLPRQIIPFCLRSLALDPDQQRHQMTGPQRKALGRWLKGCTFAIDGHRPIDEAIVTAGGVALKEVDPRTMASRLAPGLFLAGEVLDLDGDTGGYNLQAAFSTGYLAGEACASSAPAR